MNFYVPSIFYFYFRGECARSCAFTHRFRKDKFVLTGLLSRVLRGLSFYKVGSEYNVFFSV